MKTKTTLTTLMIILVASAAARADVVFSSFGPNDEFDQLFATGVGGTSDFSLANAFTPNLSFRLDSIELALGAFDVIGNSDVVILLYEDVNGFPGAVIETLGTFHVTKFTRAIYSINSTARPDLVAGTTYYVGVSPLDATSNAHWAHNAIGIIGNYQRAGSGPWDFITARESGAFRVHGTFTLLLSDFGACCLGTQCRDLMTQSNCEAFGGVWQGGATSCESTVCLNDLCESPNPIGLGDTPFTNVGANTDGPGDINMINDVWFSYLPNEDGTLAVTTCNQADYDTSLGAYVGDCGALTLIAANDDDPNCTGFTSTMPVPVQCGQSVRLRLGGYNGAFPSGSGTMTLAFTPAPPILPGDLNCDGQVDAFDIDPFVNCLITGNCGCP